MPDGADVRDTPAVGALRVTTRHNADPRVIGCAIALGGATLGVIALWLPYWDPESLRRKYAHLDELQEGTAAAPNLLDSRALAWGSLFIVIAVTCAVSVVVAYRRGRMTQGPAFAGVATILCAILAGLSADALEGGSTGFTGMEIGTAGPGLRVHAELVAGLLMLIGGLLVLRSSGVQTVVIGSAAVVLVAASIWWLAGLSEPLSPYANDIAVPGAPPDSTPSGYSNAIAGNCEALGVERIAVRFGVAPTAEDAARAVAGQQDPPWWDAAYEGCLRGFSSRR